jgi:microsomal dipeptidase-like Zn-dependent dipeptidase
MKNRGLFATIAIGLASVATLVFGKVPAQAAEPQFREQLSETVHFVRETLQQQRERLRDAEAIERLHAKRSQSSQRGRGARRANQKFLRQLRIEADALRHPEAFERAA